jgi:hypothetical protein
MKHKKEYEFLYGKVNLEKVLDSYNIKRKISYGKFGKQYRCCCPLPGHDDSSPSFGIINSSGIYNCYVCGSGNFFKFIQKMEKLATIRESIAFIKKMLNIIDEVEDPDKLQFDKIKTSFDEIECEIDIKENSEPPILQEIELPESDPAEKHFEIVKKRVSIEVAKKYKLRYCVSDTKYKGKCDGRLIIPVYFENKLVTFGGRDMTGKADAWTKMKDEAKIRNASKNEIERLREKYEFKKIIYPWKAPLSWIFYNWDDAIKFREYVMICEGILDCIRILEFGFNAVAILSCHLNDYKARLLMKHFDTIYIVLDNDRKVKKDGSISNPGQEAAKKILEKFIDFDVYNVVLPVGKDPDKCSIDEFENCVKNSKKLLENRFTFF